MTLSFIRSTPKLIAVYLVIVLLYLQIFCSAFGIHSECYASDEITCGVHLNQAEEFYYDGEFDKAIELVNQCLQNKSLSKIEQKRSYTILARTYLAQNDTIQAKDNIKNILKLDPAYQPTIEQEKPNFIKLVAKIRKEKEQFAANTRSSGLTSWLLIGAGGLAAAVFIAILTSQENGKKRAQDTSLPEPPDFPE